MPETIAYTEVKRIRISPDGTRVLLKDDSVLLFTQPRSLEIEMPNGSIVALEDAIKALQLKGYVSRSRTSATIFPAELDTYPR